MKNNVWNILKKELREVFRDKKSLSMMLVIPIMIPLLVLGMSALFEMQMNKDIEEYNKIGFAYNLDSNEKNLMEGMNIEGTVGSEEDLKKQFEQGEICLYVTKLGNQYILNYDSESSNGAFASSLVQSYFEQYKRILQADALAIYGEEAIQSLDVISITENDIGEGNFSSTYIVGYAFLFIMMAITISATYPSTDATAGEKERGTLETLLTFPIRSRDIILGKFLSVSFSSIVTGLLSLVLAMLSFLIANQQFTLYESSPISLSFLAIIISVLVIVVYSFFISGLCIAVASLSKTFKEAQSALTPLTFISFFPGMIAFMINIKTTPLISLIPFLNFSQIFIDISNGIVDYLNIVCMFASSFVYIAIVIWWIVKQYKSEKVLFSI